MGRVQHEKAHHREAFELYYALGADRNFSEVARRLNVSIQSVSSWSQAFGWQKRLAHREKIVSDLVAQKAAEDEATSRANFLKLIRATMGRYAELLQMKAVNPTPGDIAQLAKIDQLLRGQTTERSELMIGGPAFDKLIDAIAAVIEREVQDPAIRARVAAGITEAASQIGGHA